METSREQFNNSGNYWGGMTGESGIQWVKESGNKPVPKTQPVKTG